MAALAGPKFRPLSVTRKPPEVGPVEGRCCVISGGSYENSGALPAYVSNCVVMVTFTSRFSPTPGGKRTVAW